ncbi:MAG TPA: ABC transporter ATP-binding protein [Streptosporangiaceae bacterium]|jgi:ATP-binding cassette, subfamily B, bacterial|nr:ABC transporter ATP-binding protein [Streptosporangiaceae bacterium]
MDAEDCASIQEEPEARAPASSLKPVSQIPVPQTPVPQTPIQALWRLREYLRPYYRQLVVMLVAALISTGTEIAIPLLAKAAIDGPIAAAATVAIGQPHKFGVLIVIGIAAFALGAIDVLFNAVRRWIQANAVVGLEQSMRDDLYHQLQLLEPGFHDSWQSGQLLSRATTDLSAIRRFSGFGVIFLITSVVSFIVIVVLLIGLNPLLGVLTAAVFAPVSALCLRFERRYRVLSRRVQDQQDDLATNVEEAAAGIRVVKALGRREEAAATHTGLAVIVYRTQVSKAKLRGAFWAGLDLVPNLAIGLILLLGAFAVAEGELTTGGLVAFVALVLQLVWPIEALGYILALGQEAATAAQRVYEILDTPPTITSPPEPAPEAAAASPAVPQQRSDREDGRRSGAESGRLVLDHVGFSYPGATRPVLRDVSLELEPGETVALVGATGSGKTTLLNLIVRLADPTAGTIRVDGTEIRELPLPVLRTSIACAFEDPTLFSVSVRENVTLGRPDATDDEVQAALDAAQAGFVADLPWGLDTRIGEQGMSLSGGQRQRIALARAILARPTVLLLDDPLSALDVHTEAKVTHALGQVLAHATALVVAHRPSTVALADRVAIMEGGEIIATGTHHDLLATSPHYQHLMSTDAPTGAQEQSGVWR